MRKLLAIPLIALLPILAYDCSGSSYAPCEFTAAPFACGVSYVTQPGGTSAIGWGQTSEPPTFISIELTLEQAQPDGTYTGIWIDRSGLGSQTNYRDWASAFVGCAP